MSAPTRPIITLIALCSMSTAYTGASSQESGRDGAALEPAAAIEEEIIVRGRSRAALRMQRQLAEDAVYARFNEINSNDEFDIRCRREALTGSRLLRRTCQPNFWRNALADAGEETVRALQGGSAMSPQHFLGEALYKQELLAEEMQRLATEDEQFRQSLVRLASIAQAQRSGTVPRPSSTITFARDRTGEAEDLPYDAARIVDVHIGRDPWKHALSRRTFAIAQVHGEIGSIELDCERRTEQLQWAAGVEWTLPDHWGACTLRVEAPQSTTFSLYEFD